MLPRRAESQDPAEAAIPPAEKGIFWSSCCGAAETNLTRIHEDAGLNPGLAQQVKDLELP